MILSLSELASRLPARHSLLGLDYGSRHIGVAVSDPGLSLASPLCTLQRTRRGDVVAQLRGLMQERQAGGLVLGLPLRLDGTTSPAAQSVRTFAAHLDRVCGVPVALWDERFSTAAMQRELVEQADMSRAKRAAIIDKLAACYILQGALDYLRLHQNVPPPASAPLASVPESRPSADPTTTAPD